MSESPGSTARTDTNDDTTIEDLAPADYGAAAGWLSDPAINRWLSPEWRGRRVDARLLAVVCATRRNRLWLVRRAGRPFGLIALAGIDEVDGSATCWDLRGDKTLGGAGTMRRAIRLMIDEAFGGMGLRSLSCSIMAPNRAAQRNVRHAGFHRAGVLRAGLVLDGEHVDRVLYDLLPEDLPGVRPREHAERIPSIAAAGNRPASAPPGSPARADPCTETRIEDFGPAHYDVAAGWLSDPAINRWLYFEWRGRRVDARLLAVVCASRRNRLWIVRRGGRPFGLIALADIDELDRSATWWGLRGDRSGGRTGTMQDAIRLMVDTAFGEMGLRSLSFSLMAPNRASQRMLEEAGFRRAAVLRAGLVLDGEHVDRVIYDLLPEDLGSR